MSRPKKIKDIEDIVEDSRPVPLNKKPGPTRKKVNKLVQRLPGDVMNIVQEMVGPSTIKKPNPYRTSRRYAHEEGKPSPDPKLTARTIGRYENLINQRDIDLELQRQRAEKAEAYKDRFIARSHIGRNRTYAENIDFLNEVRRIGLDKDKYFRMLKKGQVDMPPITQSIVRSAPVVKNVRGKKVEAPAPQTFRRRLNFDE